MVKKRMSTYNIMVLRVIQKVYPRSIHVEVHACTCKTVGGGNDPVAQAFASNNDNFCRKPLYFKPAALAKAIAGVFVCTTLMPLDGVASIVCDHWDDVNCVFLDKGTRTSLNGLPKTSRRVDYNENGTKYFYSANENDSVNTLRNLGSGTVYVIGNSPDRKFTLGEVDFNPATFISGNYGGGKIIFKSETNSSLAMLISGNAFSKLEFSYVIENKNGVMAFIGNEKYPAVDILAEPAYQFRWGTWINYIEDSDVSFQNFDKLYLNKYWNSRFLDVDPQYKNSATNVRHNNKLEVVNKASGSIYAEAGALFTGNYSLTENKKPKTIFISNASGDVSNVTTDKFSDISYVQTGSLTLKDDWKKYSKWESGGQIIFTDVAPGTALANSITSQFQAAFGTGTSIKFTGTGSSSGSGSGSSSFDMNVVNALISEGKLASGSVVTSEALTHTGKSFTLGNTGDMTQDTGFMGIQGSTGITVKDGKTLTLMGSQATMAMAVGADTRDANYVITDAPMTLTNGTLNLGHKALSATEGTLAAVTFDRESSVNVNNGIYSIDSLKGEGSLSLSTGTRTTVVGDLSATQVTNAGTLTVNGQTVLGASPEAQSTYAASKRQTLSNEKGATANFNGGLVVNDFVQVKNREGGTLNAGHVKVDTFGRIMNYTGATMTYASIDADGIVGNQGSLNVSGAYVVGDEGETTFGGETQVGTLSVGRTAKTLLVSRDGQEAIVHNTGKTYADELDLVSGHIQVEKDGVLAGKTLKNGAVGSDITVDVGGTFGFSHDKSSLDNALKNYTGSKDDKAILALNTDLHFANGGTLTVGSVDDAKGTVNLGNDALLLLGTTQLHGEALLNGESSQHLHVEDGAVIAMTDDLLWGNHYLMKGFDDASTAEILKIGILDKDGKKLDTHENDKGIFVTVGSDKILDKDKSYRFVNQMNWLLDGHQDLTAEHGDVAFLTAALFDKQGALATNRMEALAMDAGVLAETQRMGAQVQTTMLDHASSSRKGYGTFWADGIFSKTDSGAFKRSSGTSSYEADTTGFVFGMDLPLGDDSWRLGAAFSAQRGDLDGDFGLTSDIEGYGFSVYGGKTFTSGLNLTGAMTYMTASHEVDAFNLGKVKADVDANMWVLGARVSMPFAYHQVWMTPYIGADVMKVKQDGFTSSWSDKSAFHYADVDATLFRTPVGVKAGTFMPLELLGRSGTLNWDADLSFVPQFGDKDVDYRVSGVSNGNTDGMTGSFVNDWLTTANFGMSWQGAAGAFGLYYGIEKGDVRDLSHAIRAKASLFF